MHVFFTSCHNHGCRDYGWLRFGCSETTVRLRQPDWVVVRSTSTELSFTASLPLSPWVPAREHASLPKASSLWVWLFGLPTRLCTVFMQGSWRLEEAWGPLGLELEPVLECWDSNLGPLEKQPVLLTADPPYFSYYSVYTYKNKEARTVNSIN